MEMTVFRTKVQRAVSEALGEEYSVELREVQKNNGVILQGLMIRRARENMMPTIYLNSFLKAYEEGVTFADIIRKIVTVYREDAVGKQIDISFFTDFEKVKEIIVDSLSCDESQVTMEANLKDDLEADSLDAVELIMQIEEEFEVEIPDEVASNMKTVKDIVDYIEANK